MGAIGCVFGVVRCPLWADSVLFWAGSADLPANPAGQRAAPPNVQQSGASYPPAKQEPVILRVPGEVAERLKALPC